MKGNEMKNVAATPIRIGGKTLRNRITFAPTVKFDWTDESGIAIERFARHYEERAAGGAGLVVVEATAVVCPPGGCLRTCSGCGKTPKWKVIGQLWRLSQA